MKIHITLLGQETLPLYYLVKTFPQDVVYVLCTAQNKSESKNFQQILTEFVKCNIVEVDAYDAKSVFNACENIHNQYGIDSEYSYNLTGGTKIMALAAYSIALKHNAKIFYTDSKQCISLPSFEADTLKCSVDTKTLIRLQGQKLKSYTVYKSNTELRNAALMVKEFVDKNRNFYTALGKCFRKNRERIPNGLFEKDGCIFNRQGNGFSITKGSTTLLSSTDLQMTKMLLEGRWWEVLVAEAVNKWASDRYEVWYDVQFEARENGLIKNEVDVLVSVGNTLVFIECKSGDVSQENIYTINAIRKTYGSAKAKSLLVSYFPIGVDKREKLKDSQIGIVCPAKGGAYLNEILARGMDSLIANLML